MFCRRLPCSWLCLPVAVGLAGCRSPSLPAATPPPAPPARQGRPSGSPAAVETAVRQPTAKTLKLRGEQVPLEIPFGRPPLNAAGLGTVEIVMELRERLENRIAEEEPDRVPGSEEDGELLPWLTPRMPLVIVRRAVAARLPGWRGG